MKNSGKLTALIISIAASPGYLHADESLTGESFVGTWQIKRICREHHEGHKPGEAIPHVKKDGWYTIYRKRGEGADAVYGIMISKEFADYSQLRGLMNWNDADLHFKPGKGGSPAGKFDCKDPGQIPDKLTTEAVKPGTSPTRAKLHGPTEHYVEIWLHWNSDEHPGRAAPVIKFDHSGRADLHQGILH